MEVSDRARRSQWKALSMKGVLNERCSQLKADSSVIHLIDDLVHAQAVVWSLNVASLSPLVDLGKATWSLTCQRLVFSDHPQISPYFA